MHELGIVKSIARTACEAAQENGAEQLASVTVKIGEVSGIVPYYLVDCWNYFRKKTPALAEAELRLVAIPAVTWCNACGRTYETVPHGRTCPHCGSGETWLVQGNECVVQAIEVF